MKTTRLLNVRRWKNKVGYSPTNKRGVKRGFRNFYLVIVVCLMTKSVGCFAVGATSNVATDITPLEKFVRQSLKEFEVAGVSLARVEDAEIVEVIAVGNSFANDTILSPDAVFQVGSISKPLAAWTAMTLVRDGRIDLDAPVQNYISRWVIPDSEFDAGEITLRQLLSHTAGLSVGAYSGFREKEQLPSLEQSLSGASNGAGKVQLLRSPGTEFSYSGGGYTLVQLLIEEVSGLPFNEYAEKAVLRPLGMNSSSYLPSPALLERRLEPHGFHLDPFPHHHFRAQAAASLHSTASDLAKFLVANIADNLVLTSTYIQVMQSAAADAGFAKTGLGFFIYGGGSLLGHGGANQGWRADILFSKETNSGLVVLTNSESGGALINDVRCFWDAEYNNQALQEDCLSVQVSKLNSKRLFWILSNVMIATALILVLWRLYLLLQKRANLRMPLGRCKRLSLVLSIGTGILWSIIIYTPAGARLVSGFPVKFATINYAPIGFQGFSVAVIVLLISISLCLFTKKQKSD